MTPDAIPSAIPPRGQVSVAQLGPEEGDEHHARTRSRRWPRRCRAMLSLRKVRATAMSTTATPMMSSPPRRGASAALGIGTSVEVVVAGGDGGEGAAPEADAETEEAPQRCGRPARRRSGEQHDGGGRAREPASAHAATSADDAASRPARRRQGWRAARGRPRSTAAWPARGRWCLRSRHPSARVLLSPTSLAPPGATGGDRRSAVDSGHRRTLTLLLVSAAEQGRSVTPREEAGAVGLAGALSPLGLETPLDAGLRGLGGPAGPVHPQGGGEPIAAAARAPAAGCAPGSARRRPPPAPRHRAVRAAAPAGAARARAIRRCRSAPRPGCRRCWRAGRPDRRCG